MRHTERILAACVCRVILYQFIIRCLCNENVCYTPEWAWKHENSGKKTWSWQCMQTHLCCIWQRQNYVLRIICCDCCILLGWWEGVAILQEDLVYTVGITHWKSKFFPPVVVFLFRTADIITFLHISIKNIYNCNFFVTSKAMCLVSMPLEWHKIEPFGASQVLLSPVLLHCSLVVGYWECKKVSSVALNSISVTEYLY